MSLESANAPPPAGKSNIFMRPDVLSGLMFMAVAAFGLAVSWDYPIGTGVRMGTGYVPRLFLWILFALGVVILLLGLRSDDNDTASDPPLDWRPILLVPASTIAFAVTIERYGFVVAGLLLVFIGGLASRQSRIIEVLIAAIALVFSVWALFIYALGLTFQVWPEF